LTAAIFIDAPDRVVIDRIARRDDGRDDDTPDPRSNRAAIVSLPNGRDD
jgi:hypothetical protein